MLSVALFFLAGALLGVNNVIFKKAVSLKGGTDGYVVCYYSFSSIIFLIINTFRNWEKLHEISFPTMNEYIVGALMGFLIFTAVRFFARALKCGDVGITAAIFSSSSVAEPVFARLVFGSELVEFSVFQTLGLFLVILGLVLPIIDIKNNAIGNKNYLSTTWKKNVSFAFLGNLFYMFFLRWRAYTSMYYGTSPLFFIKIQQLSFWIDSIGYFVTGALALTWLVVETKTFVTAKHALYGLPSSILLSSSHYVTVIGLLVTTSAVSAFLWPMFSASIIIFSSLSGAVVFRERVPLMQLTIISFGVLMQVFSNVL